MKNESSSPGVRALARCIGISAGKTHRVVDQIRYRPYEQAPMILESMPYRACDPVLRSVPSAAANASRSGLSKAELFVGGAETSKGTSYKRLRPRAQGRAYPIRKHTCHVTIVVRHKHA
uniref:Large ribosomal subunit protein uL22c n=1 Tax=Selaginella tamariscina TaxID=137178 RepID=A0A482CL03_9TRAC|nr:ribosomal protein L22 [Selaginella tamariscina]QBL76407.1 ribosomal protein L22 [Selaginella tamariscina]QIB71422.1 ribosomal protein L22 [Selaginella tamariscina]